MGNPRIRHVEAFPIDTENGQMVGLRDPQGVATETLIISPDVYYMLQHLDGRHSPEDLCDEYRVTFGETLEAEQLAEIIDHLDSHFFLDNPRFASRLKAVEQEFLDNPVRPAVHAGQSYESDPKALIAQLDGFYSGPGGAGKPELNGKQRQSIKALVAPHIDVRLGGASYSHAYRALAESGDADCFVILGTGHSGLHDLYSVLAKDFDTPLGTVKHDAEFINLLKGNYPAIADSEALPHKSEHVIEFQLVFLQHLLSRKKNFTFVPVLCSFSYHALTDPRFAREKTIVDTFSRKLKDTIEQFDKKVCLIASVDFCHIGPRYGDKNSPDKAFLQEVADFDGRMMADIEKVDASAFCSTVAKQEDRYRVCGFSSIYTMLNAIDAKRGRLLDYSNTTVDGQNSKVTFASMALH